GERGLRLRTARPDARARLHGCRPREPERRRLRSWPSGRRLRGTPRRNRGARARAAPRPVCARDDLWRHGSGCCHDTRTPVAEALMDFFEVVRTQRAIRRFRPDPVPDQLVHEVITAATCAPSARGAEPWGFVVVRDPARRAAIGRLYLSAW